MKGNNKNNTTHYKGRKSFFRGKTKHILLLIPAILLLTGILAATLASSQATALPALNGNPIGSPALKTNSVSTLAGSSGGLSLNGNLTITGSSVLNGNLTITKASKVILGSPLTMSGALNITGDSIEVDYPSSEGDTLTMNGNATNPAIIDLYGNILAGDPTTENGVFMNLTAYNQTIESYGPGYVGSIDNNTTVTINTNACIKVLQGTLYIAGSQQGGTDIIINSTHVNDIDLYNYDYDYGNGTIGHFHYNGICNVSQISIDQGNYVPPGGISLTGNSMWWNESIIFEAWGDPVGPGSILEGSGYLYATDAHVLMQSTAFIYYQFLSNSSGAGLNITPGASHFTRAEMDLVTPSQNLTALGCIIITNGSMSMSGSTTTPQQHIINGTLNYMGDMLLQNGNMTLQGTFNVGGGNFIKGPAVIDGSLNINNGMMTGTGTVSVSDGSYLQTVGDTTISNGALDVQHGDVVMNSSGTYIGTDTLITGDLILSGIVVDYGAVTMSGVFTFLVPMSTTGLMVTAGVNGMGGLGTINGIMTVIGNIVMSGLTTVIGENNILGSMTVTPAGVSINGLVGLMGLIRTSITPAITPETILEINSGSLMGLPIPHISVLVDPVTLLVLGILGIGTVYVVIRSVYFGIKRRRALEARIRAIGEKLRNSGRRLIEQIRGQARPGGE